MALTMIAAEVDTARNQIAPTPPEDLNVHFDKYCIPSNLKECVDQFRMDRVDAVMNQHGLTSEDLWLLVVHDEISFHSFSDVFDPLAYYEDFTAFHTAPGICAVMPPVPSNVFSRAEEAEHHAVLLDILHLRKHMKNVPIEKVIGLARVVAAYYLDNDRGFEENRWTAIRYIALNDIQNSNRKFIAKSEHWSARTRRVTLPDMVTRRKADLRELFARLDQPLKETEFNCLSTSELSEYAADQRSLVLSQNRHIVFCSKCVLQLHQIMIAMCRQPGGMVM